MKQVPYHNNPGGMACALACYTMAAQYLFPDDDITFEQLGKLADWRKDYAVWGFPVWKWLMDKGACIIDYDVIDYGKWATNGFEYLRDIFPEDEFQFYMQATYDIDAVTKQLGLVIDHPNFSYVSKKVTWDDVVSEFNKPGICDVTLNSRALNHKEGFVSHRVILVDINEDEVVFHDPNIAGTGAYRHEPLNHFRKVFESIESPELARYSLDTTP